MFQEYMGVSEKWSTLPMAIGISAVIALALDFAQFLFFDCSYLVTESFVLGLGAFAPIYLLPLASHFMLREIWSWRTSLIIVLASYALLAVPSLYCLTALVLTHFCP